MASNSGIYICGLIRAKTSRQTTLQYLEITLRNESYRDTLRAFPAQRLRRTRSRAHMAVRIRRILKAHEVRYLQAGVDVPLPGQKNPELVSNRPNLNNICLKRIADIHICS
ncbi:jg9253 [Pararge aegeria aegeria]|uniref:Jg9253 protein n=1 Tax=Pararge aegeria aegeria TaxID=348720 RepID=A0A8S4QSL5_9NEOP|nr:jg9253 [Pararge aegeria aegeria]